MRVCDIGITKYGDALAAQLEVLNDRINGRVPDTLIITEHEPTVVLGRTSEESSIRDKQYFKEKGIPVIKAARGGKITYHAPGQVALYPVIDLRERKKDIALYIDTLEKITVEVLNEFGISAERSEDRRGVWVRNRKIAFTGIAVKKWVTFHGMVVNINNDISPFSFIYPCGEKDIEVTSAKDVLGQNLSLDEVKKAFISAVKKEFTPYQTASAIG